MADNTTSVEARIEAITGRRPVSLAPLAGGCIGQVLRADFSDGAPIVAKLGGADSRLDQEGGMLTYLADHSRLPVPEVISAAPDLLLMSYFDGRDAVTPAAEAHAAELLADLHEVSADRFGFETATLIGGLVQPNPWADDWVGFFAEQRLLYMGRLALDAGRLPAAIFARLEKFAGQLERWLTSASRPSLIHGDMWGGNVLCHGGRIAGFVDPAIYYADAEIELAFATLFNTFGPAFFEAYQGRRPLAPGFFEERRDIYNLYPLLVHVRLFGGSYVASVETILAGFGF